MAAMLATAAVGACVAIAIWMLARRCWARSSVKRAFTGRHVLVTGGSSGLGLEVARQLVAAGALVTIVARREDTLAKAAADIGADDAVLKTLSADVTSSQSMRTAFEHASKLHDGRPVDDVFCCAGASVPGLFLAQEPEVYAQQMDLNYMGAVRTIHAFMRSPRSPCGPQCPPQSPTPTGSSLARSTLQPNVSSKHGDVCEASHTRNAPQRRIVLVSSTLGLTGMVGYAQYAPTKHALRGLAESLQQELAPAGVSVHVYYVGTMHTPGFENEQRSKPAITRVLEEGDAADASPAARAAALLDGVAAGRFAIASDILTRLFVLASLGTAREPNLFMALIERVFLAPFASVALYIWRLHCDRTVRRALG